MRLNRISEIIEFSKIDESMLYYSPRFRSMLRDIDSSSDEYVKKIASNMLEVELTDVKPDMTFIDMSDKDLNFISFIQINNADKKIKEIYPNIDIINGKLDKSLDVSISSINHFYLTDTNGSEMATGVFTKSRNDLKLGKFINKIFPGKFTSKQIEDFVNRFRSKIEKKDRFELVSGSDITKYYLCDNYAEGTGTLTSSCMRHSSTQNYISWYANNPDSVRLLVLFDEDDKVIGRSLVWKLDSAGADFDYLMDRIYYINDSDVDKFKDYAKSKKWAYKSVQSMDSYDKIEFDGDKRNDDSLSVRMKRSEYYPYLDTFQFYNTSEQMLYNDEDISNEDDVIILNDTGGGYESGGVYSEYYGHNINEDDAVYSEYHGSYLLSLDAVEVRNNDMWGGKDFVMSDDAIYSEYSDEYYMEGDVVYSNIHDYYLYKPDSIEVTMENDASDYFHTNGENEEFFYIDGGYYYKTLVIEDVNGYEILKSDSIAVYYCGYISEYITKFLANYLEFDIDEEDSGYINANDMDKILWMNNSELNVFMERDKIDKEYKEIEDKYKGNKAPKKRLDILNEVYARINDIISDYSGNRLLENKRIEYRFSDVNEYNKVKKSMIKLSNRYWLNVVNSDIYKKIVKSDLNIPSYKSYFDNISKRSNVKDINEFIENNSKRFVVWKSRIEPVYKAILYSNPTIDRNEMMTNLFKKYDKNINWNDISFIIINDVGLKMDKDWEKYLKSLSGDDKNNNIFKMYKDYVDYQKILAKKGELSVENFNI